MHRRQISKFIKILVAVLLYFSACLLVSYMITPKPTYNFIGSEFRVGDKYILIYLQVKKPVFSDIDGVDMFMSRRCRYCFMTNNKGFMPLSEYDAVVIQGDHNGLLARAPAFMDPGKRYFLDSDQLCLNKKFAGCEKEPKFISFETGGSFELCGLCRHLHRKRNKES